MYIEVKNVTKKIGSNTVLSGINVGMNTGKIYGLKGKNGSGKTMLMRIISGLITATEGEVVIGGKILGKDMSFPESIGLLIENPAFLPSYSGFDNLKMIASIKNIISDEEIKAVIERVGLDPEDKKKYKKYSLGMKQKLGIACAIMEKPDIIILDEPVNAVDEEGVKIIREILDELKKEDKVVILACHDKEELFYLSDEIIEIDGGIIKKQYKVDERKEEQSQQA
ncbi:MAG: ATP-binding cassette domain-containing protein [Lachnospiraceae bacterium]|nr:ATP-binding cassette domain-containing protein [Lachnospiraceae bacterium]